MAPVSKRQTRPESETLRLESVGGDFAEVAKGNGAAHTPPTRQTLGEISGMEAEKVINELMDFFKNPYGDKSAEFHLAQICFEYLQKFKVPGKKRKDKATESIMHECRSLLIAKKYLEGGILPRRITTEELFDAATERRQIKNIPYDRQSIERLFCALILHDLDEDFTEVSASKLRKFAVKKINALYEERKITKEQKKRLQHALHVDIASMAALTFGRRVLRKEKNAQGKLVDVKTTIPTHSGDRQRYVTAMENIWTGIAVKILDRLEGLTTRYGQVPDFFTIEDDIEYLKETMQLFMERQPVEDSMDRFQELKAYYKATNGMLSVAYRCFSAMTHNHPSAQKYAKDKNNLATVQINIRRALASIGKRGMNMIEMEHHPLVRMLHNYEMEAQRYPTLKPLVVQMRQQIQEFMEKPIPRAPVAIPKDPATVATRNVQKPANDDNIKSGDAYNNGLHVAPGH